MVRQFKNPKDKHDYYFWETIGMYRRRRKRGVIDDEQLSQIINHAKGKRHLEIKQLRNELELFCISNGIKTKTEVDKRYKPSKIIIHDDCIGVIANNTGNEFVFDKDMLPQLDGKGWLEDRLGYLVRHNNSNDRRGAIFAHHLVVGKPRNRKYHTDHIDRNKKNNQRENLRIIPARFNAANSGLPVNNTSGYKGVSYHKPSGKWAARIVVNKRKMHLGAFDTARDAALAYDMAAKFFCGEYALTNQKQGRL